MKIGVISDTHGLFDPAVAKVFMGVDLIIHAGDIGKLEVINSLEAISKVIAVEGNNDWFDEYPTERTEMLDGHKVIIRHIFGERHQLGRDDYLMLEQLHPDVLIFGHSHRPYAETIGRTLLFNPGSAGPKRFKLPRTVGLLELSAQKIEPKLVHLD